MKEPLTYPVLGIPVAAVTYVEACDWVLDRAQKKDRAYAVEAANTHVLSLARHEKDFGQAMAKFDLICPDGMPLVWSLNRQLPEDEQLEDRVYGPTLMLKVIEASEGSGASHFFLGGQESTLVELKQKFERENPEAKIAGVYSPPFGEWPTDEFERICALIRDSGASLVWIGLGCPKQERWIAKHLDQLPPAVYFGIGAAFAFHAGQVKQAPAIVQKNGLEWLFRLCMEPRRLWKRYFVHNSLFLYYGIRDHITSK